MEKLLVPSRRLLVRHLIGAILLQPCLSLFARQATSNSVEARKPFLGRTGA
jgi:hypothetical protein